MAKAAPRGTPKRRTAAPARKPPSKVERAPKPVAPPVPPPPPPPFGLGHSIYYTPEEKAALEREKEAPAAPARPAPLPRSPPAPVAPIAGPRLEQVPLFSARGILGLVLLCTMALPLLVVVIASLLAFSQEQAPTPGNIVSTMADLILILLLFVFLPVLYVRTVRPKVQLDEHLGLRDRRGLVRFLLGVAIGFVMIFVLAGLVWAYTTITQTEVERQSPVIEHTSRMLLAYPFLILLLPVIAGFGEEIFFRGFLQRRIGLLAAAAAFGIVHAGYGTWLQILAPFGAGLAFGWFTRRTGSLWVAIGAHFGFDLFQLLFAYWIARNPDVAALVGFT